MDRVFARARLVLVVTCVLSRTRVLLRREGSNGVAFKSRREMNLVVVWLLLLIQSVAHWEFSGDTDELLIDILISSN